MTDRPLYYLADREEQPSHASDSSDAKSADACVSAPREGIQIWDEDMQIAFLKQAGCIE